MSRLLMIAPAPVIEQTDGSVKLDTKFVDGMRRHVDEWSDRVVCLLKRGATDIPFGATYHPRDLGFELRVIDQSEKITPEHLAENDLIFAAADMFEVLSLTNPTERANGTKIVYSIEYDLPTRLRILRLDPSRNPLRKLRSVIWLLNTERQRRIAFRNCDGIQSNGYPAFKAYNKLNSNTMLYLDSRIRSDQMATDSEQKERHAYLRSGATLRLVHSGRLEPMKGAHDLIPIASLLHKAGCAFTLDIFGSGSLATEILQGIKENCLEGIVRLHGAVDFETRLIQFYRESADVFLSCHRQADPSCTYLETLGCGVPVIGYDNAMWRDMVQHSNGGWAVALGDVKAFSNQVKDLAADREVIIEASKSGLAFAQQHPFESEFKKRMSHLQDVVQVAR